MFYFMNISSKLPIYKGSSVVLNSVIHTCTYFDKYLLYNAFIYLYYSACMVILLNV